MVQKVKDRFINSFIMIVTGTIISIISVSWANSKLDSKENEEKLESKLDKKDFIEYKSDHKTDHKDQENRIINHFDSRFEDFKDFMIELNKK